MTNREYWVNVYDGVLAYQPQKHASREAAAAGFSFNKKLYRLHIKMKDMALPKYEEFDICGYRNDNT